MQHGDAEMFSISISLKVITNYVCVPVQMHLWGFDVNMSCTQIQKTSEFTQYPLLPRIKIYVFEDGCLLGSYPV